MGLRLSMFRDNGWDVFATLITWVSYNRDSYAADVAMRQNQLYQKRNYHLSWICVAREDIRDIMQASVTKVNNYMVIATLILGIAAGMTTIDMSTSASHVQGLFWMCLAISIVYLIFSIFAGAAAVNAAFSHSVDLLTKAVRPDPTDAYDESFNYMSQTQQFEKELTKVFRIPLLMPMWDNYYNGKKPEVETMTVGQLDFVEAANKPASYDANCQHANAHNKKWYFEAFNKYSLLWQCFENGAQQGMRWGGLHICYASIYAALGILTQHESQFGRYAETVVTMWTILSTSFFSFTSDRVRMKLDDTFVPIYREDSGLFSFGLKNNLALIKAHDITLYVGLVCTAMAPWAVLVLHPFASQTSRWIDPVAYGLHFVAAFFFAYRQLQLDMEVPDEIKDLRDKVSQASAPPVVGPWQQQVGRASSSAPADVGPGQSRQLQETLNLCNTMCSGADTNEPSGSASSVQNDEGRILHVWESARLAIRKQFRLVKWALFYVQAVIALGWLFLVVDSSRVWWSENDHAPAIPTQGQDVQAEWPSEFFQPLAMACAGEQIFVADKFQVYQLIQGRISLYPCNLSEGIVDISAACNGQGCWPLVLPASQKELVNCLTGEAMAFSQTERIDHVASPVNASASGSVFSSVFAVNGGELLEYRPAYSRPSLQPHWSVADLRQASIHSTDPAAGIQAVDVIADRIFVLQNAFAGGVLLGKLESRTLKRNSPISSVWSLPASISGCVLGRGSSAYVLMQSENGDLALQLFKL